MRLQRELVTLVARISLGLSSNKLLRHCALGELELPAPAPSLLLVLPYHYIKTIDKLNIVVVHHDTNDLG